MTTYIIQQLLELSTPCYVKTEKLKVDGDFGSSGKNELK